MDSEVSGTLLANEVGGRGSHAAWAANQGLMLLVWNAVGGLYAFGDIWPILLLNPLTSLFNSLSSGCPGTCYVAKDELGPLTFVPLPPAR